jgi:GTP cyclohydrolase I
MTRQIADAIEEHLKPQGVAVYIEGRHFCMESRGVQKPGVSTDTSAMRGSFKENDKTRMEFMNSILRGRQ